jgi:carboxymethylenebutenolidase
MRGSQPDSENSLAKIVDYYFSPVSPWTYLGHERLTAIAKKHGANVAPKPVDYGRIFPVSGGVPVKQRALQRQAYRLVELRRWQAHIGLAMTIEPKYFPAPADSAAVLICAAARASGADVAMKLAVAFMRACWSEERNIGDEPTLDQVAREQGIDPVALRADSAARAVYDKFTQEAIDRGVFGAPSYVYQDEIFWGQDRLEFLDRALGKS